MRTGNSVLRGTKTGLEFIFTQETFGDAVTELTGRMEERPGFYRGSRATAQFIDLVPSGEALANFLESVRGWGIELSGVYGEEALAELALFHGLEYLGAPPKPAVANLERKRAARSLREVELTDRARSLDADFEGARNEIALRRARGEASVRRPDFAALNGKARPAAAVPEAALEPPSVPATLYHRGTVRGGQSLQQIGNIVIAGDVNPGAELVASGDILVFGALRGTAHAGAQGDATARVFALELVPTQLRIATFIAAGETGRRAEKPEVAFVKDDAIAIALCSDGMFRT
jgi:septum site-determining protein MinC